MSSTSLAWILQLTDPTAEPSDVVFRHAAAQRPRERRQRSASEGKGEATAAREASIEKVGPPESNEKMDIPESNHLYVYIYMYML